MSGFTFDGDHWADDDVGGALEGAAVAVEVGDEGPLGAVGVHGQAVDVLAALQRTPVAVKVGRMLAIAAGLGIRTFEVFAALKK